MDQQGFERTVKKSADQIGASATIDVNFSDYNGWCIKTEKSDAVYFVMGGEKRYIPNMDTLNGLFSGQNIHGWNQPGGKSLDKIGRGNAIRR